MLKKYLIKNFLEMAMLMVNTAEQEITGSGKGARRLAYCVETIRNALPWYLSWAISDEMVQWLVQWAFDIMRKGITLAQAGI